jgi:homoserine dehydrogenase
VAPKLVSPDSPFYSVSGTSKLAVFTSQKHEEISVSAQSGREAIAQIIASDILYALTGVFPKGHRT